MHVKPQLGGRKKFDRRFVAWRKNKGAAEWKHKRGGFKRTAWEFWAQKDTSSGWHYIKLGAFDFLFDWSVIVGSDSPSLPYPCPHSNPHALRSSLQTYLQVTQKKFASPDKEQNKTQTTKPNQNNKKRCKMELSKEQNKDSSFFIIKAETNFPLTSPTQSFLLSFLLIVIWLGDSEGFRRNELITQTFVFL